MSVVTRRRCGALLIGGCAAALLAVPSGASASQLKFSRDPFTGGSSVLYTADSLEKNQITMTAAGDKVTVTDKGAALIRPDLSTPENNTTECQFSLTTVTCPKPTG